jgi:penicillin-binding protein 2
MSPRQLDDRRPAFTPQLAVRVAVLGFLAFALFAIVFFRLWFLQVLSGQEYVSQARENRVRRVSIEAPRGDIVDRSGRTLVTTRAAPVVQILPNSLPAAELAAAESYRKAMSAAESARLAQADRLKEYDRQLREDGRRSTRAERRKRARLERAAERARPVALPPIPRRAPGLRRLYRRLGAVLGMRPATIHRRVVEGIAEAPYASVTIKTDVPQAAYNYLYERRDEFPGVTVEQVFLRKYPHDDLAAQIFGSVREISPEELRERRYRGLHPGARIGVEGLEEEYDQYLRGQDGYSRVVINALGSRDDRRAITRKEPVQGQQLRLSLDLGLQEAGQRALQEAVAQARLKYPDAQAGAFVALDPRNGEVLALGSYPSFNANVFAKPLDQKTFDRLNSQANGAPLFNRAISATYPTGSTFKPITAVASLESGIFSLGQTIYDGGSFSLGSQVRQNAGGARYGTLNMTEALKVSSDVFFYTLGKWANDHGDVIQRWARRLGLGHPTGIDLPGEFGGLVPDRAWRDAGYAKYVRCVKREHVPAGTEQALYACGGIERPWSVGDNVSLAVGQGDLQATPLQMAVAYSAIVNGGKVVRPHLGIAIEDGTGTQVEELRHPARRKLDIAPAYRDAIMSGLRKAAGEPRGTSYDVFKDFPLPVYGKTGTAERPPQPDQSWYVAYVPHATRPIVVAVTVEKGGFGAETAAPAAKLILADWFHVKASFKPGASATR